MAANLGAITGYTLSGLMISYFGWQSIFFDQCAYRNFRHRLGIFAVERSQFFVQSG